MTDQLTDVRGGTASDLTRAWAGDPRWLGIKRSYTAQDVVKLRGTVQERQTLAERGARRLWELLHSEAYIHALGALNRFERMKSMTAAGAAGVHWEDQLASEKKCGHLGGKVLIPTAQHIRTLTSARLAADVADVPTVVIARTDAEAATLITSDVDERDQPFISGERTKEGFYRVKNGLEPCIARAKSYAPYSDLIWMETGTPDLELAKKFAEGVMSEFPGQMLAYNCSPSFNWKQHLDDATIAKFQNQLGAMGFKFQFITLAGCDALNYSMFDLAHGYARNH